MITYHINSQGEPKPCRAQINCPFGPIEAHHITPEEARRAYENNNEIILSELAKAQTNLENKEAVYERIETALQRQVEKIKKGDLKAEGLLTLEKDLDEATTALRLAGYENDKWSKAAVKANINDFDPDKKRFTKASERSNQRYRATLRTVVDFTKAGQSLAMYREAINEFTAWSGVEREEAKILMRSNKTTGLSKDEHIVKLFQDYAKTNKKAMVFVDLETTGFHPTMAEIIEIGVIKVDAEGNVLDSMNERFDLDEPWVRDTLGVGPTDVHKISPEDVKGKAKFTDPAMQERMAALLNDRESVFCAHNANFEKNFLNHYLTGFRGARESDSYENLSQKKEAAPVTDTRQLAMFFTHSLPNTKLESFTQGNGVAYENAHSGYDDAKMTMQAFFNFKESLMASPPGERPQLSWNGMSEKKKYIKK